MMKTPIIINLDSFGSLPKTEHIIFLEDITNMMYEEPTQDMPNGRTRICFNGHNIEFCGKDNCKIINLILEKNEKTHTNPTKTSHRKGE